MAKVLNAYRLITAATIKANAEIPNQADMTVVGTTVECINISTTKIKNVIGHTNNKLSELCAAVGINHWSGFGPTKRTISGSGASGEIVNSDPTANYKIGDYPGYNHGAVTPGWNNKAAAEADKWIDSGNNVTFIADIQIGEARYAEDLAGIANIVGIALVAYEYGTTTVKAFGITSLSSCSIAANLTAVTTVGVTLQTRYDIKVFFVSSLTNLDIVCRVPNITDGSCYAKIKQATSWSMTSGWNTTVDLRLNDGYLTINNAYKNQYMVELTVTANLRNWLGEIVQSVELYRAEYLANQDLDFYAFCGMANIPNYGYSLSVDFVESA